MSEWIPVSERLPTLNDDGVSDMVLLCWSDGQRTVGAYCGDRTFVGQAWPEAKDVRVTVTAWQPLPEPYRESEEDMSRTIKPKDIKTGFVYCVTSGKGFVEGCIYAQIGWNNGVHILRENEQGDVVDELFCTGGIGKGIFNEWDDSGSPSFNPIVPKKWEKGEYWVEESEE